MLARGETEGRRRVETVWSQPTATGVPAAAILSDVWSCSCPRRQPTEGRKMALRKFDHSSLRLQDVQQSAALSFAAPHQKHLTVIPCSPPSNRTRNSRHVAARFVPALACRIAGGEFPRFFVSGRFDRANSVARSQALGQASDGGIRLRALQRPSDLRRLPQVGPERRH